MRDHRTISTAVVLAVVMSAPIQAQLTIPEAIAQGAAGTLETAPSGPVPRIDDVVLETEIAVRGIIGEPRSRLSADQLSILTDYPLVDPVILFQATMMVSDTPGVMPPIVITQRGGTLMINGHPFVHTSMVRAPLQPGAEGLFLLKRIEDEHRIVGISYGAFSIADGRLKPLTRRESFAPELRNVPAAQAVERIVAALIARQ